MRYFFSVLFLTIFYAHVANAWTLDGEGITTQHGLVPWTSLNKIELLDQRFESSLHSIELLNQHLKLLETDFNNLEQRVEIVENQVARMRSIICVVGAAALAVAAVVVYRHYSDSSTDETSDDEFQSDVFEDEQDQQ